MKNIPAGIDINTAALMILNIHSHTNENDLSWNTIVTKVCGSKKNEKNCPYAFVISDANE